MLQREARWLGETIYRFDPSVLFPMLNFDSSTEEFRTRTQPWIDRCVFAPARKKGLKVVHMDMKAAPGVDIVGDIFDAATAAKLASMKFRSVLCSNLLEHVEDRQRISSLLESIVSPSGLIIVSCPYRYPYHPDPIDTGYRPSPEGIASIFKQSRLVRGQILDCGIYLERLIRDPLLLTKMFVRLLIPFYKPAEWWATLRLQAWLFRNLRVSCAVLQKV
jgi:SAM-dependent methyltransferase